MQDIERYGLITLLFLVASVTAVFLWGGDAPAGEALSAEVAAGSARSSVSGTQLESRRTTSQVPTNPNRGQVDGTRPGRPQANPQDQAVAEQLAAQAAEAERRRLVEQRRRERELADQRRAEREAELAAAEAARQGRVEERVVTQAVPGADVVREQAALVREVTVAAGDSFWKIAERELGNGLRADKISALNPDVDSKRLKVGQKLLIPTAAGLAAHEQATAQAVVAKREQAPAERAPESVSTATSDSYQVREGDSAWVVAKRLCGRGSRWEELEPLNPSVELSSLKIGQTLRVPSDWSRASGSTVAQSSSSRSTGRSLVR